MPKMFMVLEDVCHHKESNLVPKFLKDHLQNLTLNMIMNFKKELKLMIHL